MPHVTRAPRLLALGLLLAAVASGCGGERDDEPGSSAGATFAPGAKVVADLRVTRTDADGGSTTREVRCNSLGRAAFDVVCVRMSELGSEPLLGPLGPVCTEIYGGPERGRVLGTVNGAAVDVPLARTNGCEIARWEAWDHVLGD